MSDRLEVLTGFDALAQQELLSKGEASSRDLLEHSFGQIARLDGAWATGITGLHAVVDLNRHAAVDAEHLDSERNQGTVRGPLHGLPVLVKENINVAGIPTRAGFGTQLNDLIPSRDATVVHRLRTAGAVVVGSTDGGSASSLNPFDQTKSPGGSSSGNGVALASSYTALALGTCTTGSTRIPAAWTSTVGFRPTNGIVSMHGVAPSMSAYDTPGPMSTTVAGVALLMDVIVGDDPVYDRSNRQQQFHQALSPTALQGRTIGIYEPYMLASDAAISDVIRQAADDMARLGASVVSLNDEVSFEVSGTPPGCELLWETAGSRGLNSTAGLKAGTALVRARDEWLAGFGGRPERLAHFTLPRDKITHADLALATNTEPPSPATEADLRRHARLLNQLSSWLSRVLDAHSIDAVIYPTVRKPPQLHSWGFMWQNTSLAALSSSPAVSVPAGFVGDLPVGIDFMGRRSEDVRLLGMAYAYEQATQHRRVAHPACL